MNTLTLQLPSGRPTRGFGILRFFNDLADGFRDGLDLARRYDTLSQKSDSDLAQLGLRREDIPQAVLRQRAR